MAKFIELFEAARRSGAPLLGIRTADPEACIASTMPMLNETHVDKNCPVVQWDAARGIMPRNEAGQQAMSEAGIKPDETVGFIEAMLAAQRLPELTVLFVHHANRQLHSMEPKETAQAIQCILNLRDQYKENFRTLAMVGPSFVAPAEMEHDVVILDEPLPDRKALSAIVSGLYAASGLEKTLGRLKDAVLRKATDALTGLSHFAAETVVAMSLKEDGLDIEALWARKIATINNTPGLHVWRGGERFSDLVGLDAIKQHLRNRMNAKTPIGVAVWIDEIDKVFADSSVGSVATGNNSMDQLRTTLYTMENNRWKGLVAVGVGGGGKSAIAKAFGNEAGVLTVSLDLAGTESKWVGESEQNLRRAIQVIEAIGDGHAYVLATSNNATVMRPELQRRFTDGMWMFDLPTKEQRSAAWKLYQAKNNLKDQPLPDDERMTAAEIRNICEYADDVGCTIMTASQFTIPMAASRVEEIEHLRMYAQNRFLDANTGNKYKYDAAPMVAAVRAVILQPSLKKGEKETVN